MGLSGAIKRALGQIHAAPEILFAVFGCQLDPKLRWFISSLRLYVHCTKCELGRDVLRTLSLSRRNSRLAGFIRVCLSMGWLLQGKWRYFPDDDCNLHRTWTDLKARVIKQYHLFRFQKLEERRPSLFRGIGELNCKAHVTILKKHHSYHAATLVKIWTGSVMTRSHRATLDANVDPTCECGQGPQTLAHLLYHCPLQSPVNPEIFAWRLKPPSNSCALLATKGHHKRRITCMGRCLYESSVGCVISCNSYRDYRVEGA